VSGSHGVTFWKVEVKLREIREGERWRDRRDSYRDWKFVKYTVGFSLPRLMGSGKVSWEIAHTGRAHSEALWRRSLCRHSEGVCGELLMVLDSEWVISGLKRSHGGEGDLV
jgi:hypothetical protein